MILSDFISMLQYIEDKGHGDKQVYYRHSSSGDCGHLHGAVVTDAVEDECGPFDLKEGEVYISICAGN